MCWKAQILKVQRKKRKKVCGNEEVSWNLRLPKFLPWRILRGQTSTFNNLGPISSRLRFGDTKEFIILSTNFQIFGNLATPELTRSASSARISKFDPPLDAQGPVLSSTSGQHKYLPLTSNLFRFAAELWESGEWPREHVQFAKHSISAGINFDAYDNIEGEVSVSNLATDILYKCSFWGEQQKCNGTVRRLDRL